MRYHIVVSSPGMAAAVQLVNAGRGDLAERELRRLLAAEPEDAALHGLLSLALLQQRKYGLALAAAQEGARLQPDHVWVRQALAEVQTQTSAGKRGVAAARAALEVAPHEAKFHGLLAAALLNASWWPFSRRKVEEALRAAEAGLALDPGHVNCMLMRAQALVRLKRVDEARAVAEAALGLEPELPGTHIVGAIVDRASGKKRDGRAKLREALRLDPHHPLAQRHLGVARMGDAFHRDSAAMVVVGQRELRVLVRGGVAVLLAAGCIGLFRPGMDGYPWFALFPFMIAALPPIIAKSVRNQAPHLLVDLRAPGALLPQERFGARLGIVFWAMMGLCSAVYAVFA